MEYIIVTAVFFVLLMVYFRIATKYNIIDHPNHRTSHSDITVRGGGIIFPIAYLLFIGTEMFFNSDGLYGAEDQPNFFVFGAGFLLITILSFVDDLVDLPTKTRLIFHFIAVTLLLHFVNGFTILPIWELPFVYILAIGILNAYNFMDGINGISGVYSLVILGSLWYVNQEIAPFILKDFIVYPTLACIVFLFFNFRKRAKCFLGDVGSMGIAFWIIALIAMLIIKTGDFKWLLFLSLYGIDTVITIVERIKRRENILEAHRRHLYQLFVNEQKQSHLTVSLLYGLFQLLINIFVILSGLNTWFIFAMILIPTAILYIFLKLNILKKSLIKQS
ncbi:MraY family glycosyltransferase [Kaistella polysaccharea]|uniref:MraY family glycosyltransferase n=1 Tax=Kaistella polysaccharea TaxID=2878534 RepID=UPI001CF1EDB7|nr:glycosyltransferase family 4 protein [Kaistella polysaccharea]